jgi:hypothetical protein
MDEASELEPGTFVRLFGIQARPEFNGKVGVIDGSRTDDDRYPVWVPIDEHSSQTHKIKRQKLTPTRDQPDRPRPQFSQAEPEAPLPTSGLPIRDKETEVGEDEGRSLCYGCALATLLHACTSVLHACTPLERMHTLERRHTDPSRKAQALRNARLA